MMESRTVVRWGAVSTLVGGLAWVALSVESVARPDPERYRTVLFLVPWLLSAGAIVGLQHLAARGERSPGAGRVLGHGLGDARRGYGHGGLPGGP